MEAAAFIRQTFEPVVILTTYPRSEIEIFIQIIQLDGGALSAAINAACLALVDAGIAMYDFVVSCAAGFANDTAMLDLNYIEESAETPSLCIAMLPKSKQMTMLNVNYSLKHH